MISGILQQELGIVNSSENHGTKELSVSEHTSYVLLTVDERFRVDNKIDDHMRKK